MITARTSICAAASLALCTAVLAQEKPATDRRPIRVLYVDGSPRWEYRHLTRLLTRSPEVATQTWLASADPGWDHPHSKSLPVLQHLPRTLEELSTYDVVLVGDVEIPNSRKWCETLAVFARGGGGIGLLAGEHHWDVQLERGFRDLLPTDSTKKMLAQLRLGRGFGRALPMSLPVSFSAAEAADHAGQKLPDSSLHPILRIAETDAKSRRVWRSLRFHKFIAMNPSKKSCRVLVSHSTRGKVYPLLATARLGAGRSLVLATDDTWRWRGYDRDYHLRFWMNVVAFLGGSPPAAGKPPSAVHSESGPKRKRAP